MTKSRSLLRWGLVGGVVGAISLAASASQAQVNVYSGEGLNVDMGATAAVAWITTRNAYFGSGGDFGGNPEETDTTWQESYIEPWAGATYDLGDGQAYLNASFIASATRGDGDVSGFLVSGSETIDAETYYLGWSGDMMGGTGVNVSYGRQEFHVGTDFVIGIGHFASGNEGAYWTGPSYAFERAGILSLEGVAVDGLRADLFHITSDETQYNTEFAGVNVEYHDEDLGGDVGFMYLDGTGSDLPTRDGMQVLDLRYHGNPMASQMPNWHFAVEYVDQTNDDLAAEVDAVAYYFDIGYTFVDWPWAPDVTYRFAHFSGDDPNTAENELYDGLFYGFTNWGTWFIGEVAGEYMIFNQNFDVHMLMVQASPYDNLFVTVAGFDFTTDEPSLGMDDKFGQELNFIADLSLGDNMSITANYAVHIPDNPVGNPLFGVGGDDNFHVMHAGAWVWF